MIRNPIKFNPVQADAALCSPEYNKRLDDAGLILRIERHPDITSRVYGRDEA